MNENVWIEILVTKRATNNIDIDLHTPAMNRHESSRAPPRAKTSAAAGLESPRGPIALCVSCEAPLLARCPSSEAALSSVHFHLSSLAHFISIPLTRNNGLATNRLPSR